MRKWFEAKYPPADVAIHGRVMKDHSRKRSDYARVDPFQPCSDYKCLKSEWHEAAGRHREGGLMREEGMGVEHLCEDDLLSIQAADEYLSRRYEYTPSERLAQVEGDYENENEGSELK